MVNTQQNTIAAQEENPSDEERVAQYLQRHPDFFTRHSALLAELIIPHGTDSVVSLVERQISLLREKNTTLEEQQNKLREIAMLNDRVQERMHRIVLQILSATDVNQGIRELTDSLAREFDLVHVRLRLFDDESRPLSGVKPAFRITSRSAHAALNEFTPKSRPICGQLSALQHKRIFGRHAASVGSSVIIPLRKDTLHGIIALGTTDKNRFTANMDTLYLQRLGEIVAALLVHLVT